MEQPAPDLDADPIVCRCEGITESSLRSAIQQSNALTINSLKKLTRAGMGMCQGRTCAGLLERILSSEAHVAQGTEPFYSRPPVRAVPLGALALAADHFDRPAGAVNAAVLWGLAEGGATLHVEEVNKEDAPK